MLKNGTLKNSMSRIGLYGSAPPPPGHQPTDWSVYEYRIFFIKDPIASKVFISLISTIANIMPESM